MLGKKGREREREKINNKVGFKKTLSKALFSEG